MQLRKRVRRISRQLGFEISRYSPDRHPSAKRGWILRTRGIQLVLDVGANTGQFAEHLRKDLGYKGRIVSFEPLSSAFTGLTQRASRDKNWEVMNLALGDQPGDANINISANSPSSSLLGMLPRHLEAAPHSQYLATERIRVETLDRLWATLEPNPSPTFLKVDTQGYERNVFQGALRSLESVDAIQVEMSLVPLYEGQATYLEMLEYLSRLGYGVASIAPGLTDPLTGQLLQIDVIVQRF